MRNKLMEYIKEELTAVALQQGIEMSKEQELRAIIEVENEMQAVFDNMATEVLFDIEEENKINS